MKALTINGVQIEESTRIEFQVTENPKRSGSQAAERFDNYMKAETVGEYFELGAVRGDLKYDFEHGFLQIEGVE